MRKLLFALPLVGALALAGCATNPLTNLFPSGLPSAAQVVSVAKATCSVVPNIVDVATLISTNPEIGTAAGFAAAICAAVNNLAARHGAPGSVNVNGVRVRLGARRGAAGNDVVVNGGTLRFTQQ